MTQVGISHRESNSPGERTPPCLPKVSHRAAVSEGSGVRGWPGGMEAAGLWAARCGATYGHPSRPHSASSPLAQKGIVRRRAPVHGIHPIQGIIFFRWVCVIFPPLPDANDHRSEPWPDTALFVPPRRPLSGAQGRGQSGQAPILGGLTARGCSRSGRPGRGKRA